MRASTCIGPMRAPIHTACSTLKPRVPLLSQGWALVGALRGAIPDELQILRAELQPSLWSLYSPAGVQAIHHWMDKLGTEDTITTTGAVQ